MIKKLSALFVLGEAARSSPYLDHALWGTLGALRRAFNAWIQVALHLHPLAIDFDLDQDVPAALVVHVDLVVFGVLHGCAA